MLSRKQLEGMNATDLKDLEMRVLLPVKMCLADEMMYHVRD